MKPTYWDITGKLTDELYFDIFKLVKIVLQKNYLREMVIAKRSWNPPPPVGGRRTRFSGYDQCWRGSHLGLEENEKRNRALGDKIMSTEFAIAKVLPGTLNALVKNIMRQTGATDPNEAVRLVNSGEWVVSKPTRLWREQDGII
jgi:hypothetical protein